MSGTLSRWAVCVLLACLCQPVSGQESAESDRCGPDEIDMGDYCARRPPEAAQLKPGARRATPFRVKSMMPGHVGEKPNPRLKPIPNSAAELPLPAGKRFGVQLGVFSSRETAEQIAHDAEKQVGGVFTLARIPREERILWAAIYGPFPDENSAGDAMRRLREKTRHKEAFVKPLDNLDLLDLNDANTEK